MSVGFQRTIAVLIAVFVIMMNYIFSGCASKSIKFNTIDERGNPVSIDAQITYFCTDQKTNDFSAVAPGGLKIKFAGQESNAKTEVALEFLRLLNSLPAQ